MKIELYKNKTECCGCSACVNICPKSTIKMSKDINGFTYPEINHDNCINCKLCKKVCAYQNKYIENKSSIAYVAKTNSTDILKSASGGGFAAIAKAILDDNGVVYGSALERTDNGLIAKHISVNKVRELDRILGSKYVQSELGNIYKEVKKNLEDSKLVLFSGTPCQVDGLNGYLGKQYSNLLTIDIICHGVPSNQMFSDYINNLEKKIKGKITNYYFRDKTNGWGLNGKYEYINLKGDKKEKIFEYWESSYYDMFLKSDIYRENCYSCKYASLNRPSDLTLGDYWGIEEMHPDLIMKNGGNINEKEGVSSIIVNTIKGKEYLEKYSKGISLWSSTVDKVKVYNAQLNKPSKKSIKRSEIFRIYRENGYKGVEKWYINSKGIKYKIKKIIKIFK